MPLRIAEPAEEAYHYPLTIRHLLATSLLTAAQERIIYRDQASYTYQEFPGRVGRLASMLQKIGAEQGMTIAVMDWDSHRYLEAYFAIPMMGSVLQTVNVRIPVDQVSYTLEHAKAEILLVHRDFFDLAEAVLPNLPGIKAVIAIMDGSDDPLPQWACGEYETLSAEASPDFPFEDFDENAVATTFYTTGTTGNPKGVCFTHRQLVLHTLAVKAPFGATDHQIGVGVGDVYMPLTPMFHVHAWGMPYITTMLGLKQVYPGRYEADMICRLRQDHGVTYSHCVPTILQMVLDSAAQTGADLTGWKMTIGGARLPEPLFDAATARGMRVTAGYGMSETCPVLTITRLPAAPDEMSADEIRHARTAAGLPMPLVHVRIVDENMNEVPHDGVSRGELVVRAPWLTPCYTRNPTSSAELWRGGWLHTQDIATIDETGCVRIRDRLKDVIKSGGEWIDSLQLEELIGKVDGVAQVAVVAKPDPRWGERPFAVVVPAPGTSVELGDLNSMIAQAIEAGGVSRYAKLQDMALVSALPLTSVGKTDKKVLRATYCSATEDLSPSAAS